MPQTRPPIGAAPTSLAAFLLLFAFLSSHILLQAAVDDLELPLDSGGAAHPGSYTLLSHQVGDLPLLLAQPSLLVDAAGGRERWDRSSERDCCRKRLWHTSPDQYQVPSPAVPQDGALPPLSPPHTQPSWFNMPCRMGFCDHKRSGSQLHHSPPQLGHLLPL